MRKYFHSPHEANGSLWKVFENYFCWFSNGEREKNWLFICRTLLCSIDFECQFQWAFNLWRSHTPKYRRLCRVFAQTATIDTQAPLPMCHCANYVIHNRPATPLYPLLLNFFHPNDEYPAIVTVEFVFPLRLDSASTSNDCLFDMHKESTYWRERCLFVHLRIHSRCVCVCLWLQYTDCINITLTEIIHTICLKFFVDKSILHVSIDWNAKLTLCLFIDAYNNITVCWWRCWHSI